MEKKVLGVLVARGPLGVTVFMRVGCGAAEGMVGDKGEHGALGPAWKWPSCLPGQPALPCERRREAFEGRGIGTKGPTGWGRIKRQ